MLSLLLSAATIHAGDPPIISKVRLPIQFAENVGQWESSVRFGIVRGMEKAAFTDEGVYVFRPLKRSTTIPAGDMPSTASEEDMERKLHTAALCFVNPHPEMRVEGVEMSDTRTHFYAGTDSAAWYANVPTYRGVRYVNIWPGIDIDYVERDGKLLQRIEAAPGADLSRVAILERNIAAGEFENRGGERSPDDSRTGGVLYLDGDTLRVRPYRNFFHRRLLIETEFNTYFGGSGADELKGMDMDEAGAIYLYMLTSSMDLPVRNAFQPAHKGGHFNLDCYVVCMEHDMRSMRYGTYIGGSADDPASPFRGITPTANGGMLALGNEGGVYVLSNPQSNDFPSTSGSLQSQRYNSPSALRRNSCTSVLRFDSLGRLDAATWLGGPTWFGGYVLDTGPDGSVSVLGTSSGEQWFVMPGAVQDKLYNSSPKGDDQVFMIALVRLAPRLDSVLAGTYFFAPDGYADTTQSIGPQYLWMEVDQSGSVVMGGHWMGPFLPLKNAWLNIGKPYHPYLAKFCPTLDTLVFCTHLPGPAEYGSNSAAFPAIHHIDPYCNIFYLGVIEPPDTLVVRQPIPGGKPYTFMAKFSPVGGDPVFASYLPWNDGSSSAQLTLNDSRLLLTDRCQRLVVFGYTFGSEGELPLVSALDTSRSSTISHFMVTMDPDARQVDQSGYWHSDSNYTTEIMTYLGGPGSHWDNTGMSCHLGRIDAHNNLIVGGGTDSNPAWHIDPLRAFQSQSGGGSSDIVIIRTRVTGCELMTCDIGMPTAVTIGVQPPVFTPRYFPITVTLRNVHASRSAREIECVLTLRPGLELDPPGQPLRKSLGARVFGPGDSEMFTWTVRVDSAKLSGEGVWVDAVLSYRDADETYSGLPAVSHCEEFLHRASVEHPLPEVSCSLSLPDSLHVSANGEEYEPLPFPVRLEVLNTGTVPVQLSRVGLFFASGMSAEPSPVSSRYQNGGVIAPGKSFAAQWHATAERRAEERRILAYVIGWDAVGNAVTWCESEIVVPGLIPPGFNPLRCALYRTPSVTWNTRTGTAEPSDIRASLSVRQLLDTLVSPVIVNADLASCRSLSLANGENAIRTIHNLNPRETWNLHWQLAVTTPPTMHREDTMYFHLSAMNGSWTRDCMMVIPIRIVDESLICSLTGPDSLSVAQLENHENVQLDFTLSNVGTVPVTINRVDLAISSGAGILPLDALSQPGGSLAQSGNMNEQWRLRPLALRNERTARLEVTAYGAADSVLSVCTHDMHIPGIDVLLCDITATDSVRFIRDPLGYHPDPLPITLELRTILDTPETRIEAEIDLTAAQRFELATGETAIKTLASIDSNSAEQLLWLLRPLPGSATEAQHLTIRYRSTEQGEWKECSSEIIIEAWPLVQTTHCVVSGHDSLHADQAYERIIPEPFEISYTATNTGTVALRNCAATIVLPPEFELVSDSATLSFGELRPGNSNTRWWTLKTTPALAGYGPYSVNFTWYSDEQGSSTGCDHTVHVLRDASSGIAFTPLHLHFEAVKDEALPAAQHVQLWTGGGLSMPWTAQGGQWWLNADPVSGDHAARIAVQPNSTALPVGLHSTALTIAGQTPNLPKDVAVTYEIRGLLSLQTPGGRLASLGPMYPQPVPLNGEAHISINVPAGEYVRIALYDALGREVAVVKEGVLPEQEWQIRFSPARHRLTPGLYLLRMISSGGQSVRGVVVR